MKAIVILSVLLVGCVTPCAGTAKHAVAMMRYCVDTKDEATIDACAKAYEEVRDAMTQGACAVEVTR